MDVKTGILLLFAATCCSGLTVKTTFDKDFSFTNDPDTKNVIECTLTPTKQEVAKDLTLNFKITNKYDESIFCEQQITLKKGETSKSFACQLNVHLKTEIVDGYDNTMTFVASAVGKEDKKINGKSDPLKINILDVTARSGSSIKMDQDKGCTVDLNVIYPYTFPVADRAECGVWNKVSGQFVTKPQGIPYFDSKANPNPWKFEGIGDGKRKSLTLSNTIDLTTLQKLDKTDLGNSKQIKCRLSFKPPFNSYNPNMDFFPKVENDADFCKANPLDGIMAKPEWKNKNIKFVSNEEIESCYMKDKVATMSYYKCDYDQTTIEARCDRSSKKYQLRKDNDEFKNYDDDDAKDFIKSCLHEPKTLVIHPIEVEGVFKNVIQKKGNDQKAICSFDVGEEDIYTEKITATINILAGTDIIDTHDEHIEKGSFNGTKTFDRSASIDTTKLVAGKTARLSCRVTLGLFAKPRSTSNQFEVIEIHNGPTETDVKVDNEKCEVQFNKVNQQPSNPEGLAFCGIWTSKAGEKEEDGSWLEGPKEEELSDLSYSSSRNGTRWGKKTGKDGFTQFTLKDRKIALSHLDKNMRNWVKCAWMFPHFNSSLDDAIISTYHSEINAQNDADHCEKNPVMDKDKKLKDNHAKVIIDVEKSSCYKDQVKRQLSVLVQCIDTKNTLSVTCKDKKYVMTTGSKKAVPYTEKDFDKFLETCGAGSVFVSNVLMGVLMLVLYFKSH